MEEDPIEKTLRHHLTLVESLRFGYSDGAEELYQKTKMYDKLYFRHSYAVDLVGLKFRVTFSTLETLQGVWTVNYPKLKSIVKTMLEQYLLEKGKTKTPQIKYVQVENKAEIERQGKQIDELLDKMDELMNVNESQRSVIERQALKERKLKKGALFTVLLLISSFLLWSFNEWLRWSWLANHPKKIAIYVTVQVILFLLFLRLVIRSKIITWAAIGAVLLVLLQAI
jgi:hypothetical protein